MEEYDLLLVGAEISVAFAGFAGIIATFQFRDTETVQRGDVVGLAMIVQISLIACLYCLIPPILHILELEESEIWTISSVLFIPAYLVFMYSIHKNISGYVKKARLKILFGSLQILAFTAVAMLFLNISNIFFHGEPTPYLIGLVYGWILVAYMFIRLLLRPLWISVHRREMADNESGAPEK